MAGYACPAIAEYEPLTAAIDLVVNPAQALRQFTSPEKVPKHELGRSNSVDHGWNRIIW
jgi:hypothetical protein